ncbi:response regulator [Candidatus Sumerlaeota bacterium]|nr:response regulator [Candidatus Sumerlaeota bacterium]
MMLEIETSPIAKMQGRILVVDDDPKNLLLATDMVHSIGLEVVTAANGEEAIQRVGESSPDVILLDAMMPVMDGFETCRRLKTDPRTNHIPVIMLTGLNSVNDYIMAIEAGADDFMNKPFNAAVMQVRVKGFLKTKRMHDELDEYRHFLEKRVREQTEIIQEVQDVTIFSLAKLAEYRDPETGEHLERMRHYCRMITQRLGAQGTLGADIDEEYVRSIFRSSILHDIGKVGIPDNILLKPGKLDSGEWLVMKTHTSIGGAALGEAARRLKRGRNRRGFLDMASSIATFHHEKYDGSGYPDGLAGDKIPLEARIVAVADVFDALLSKRPYKDPVPLAKAIEILREGRGTHFDPMILDCFLNSLDEINAITTRFADKSNEE